MSLPYISIIIPTKNEEKNLARILASIKNICYPKNKYEVIVVDGCSNDKTVKIAKKFKVKVIINNEKNRSSGCQLGVDEAKGSHVAFTDADCVVPKNWLNGLLEGFTGNKIVSIGGPNITPDDDLPFAKALGDVISLLTKPGARYGFSGGKLRETFHNSGCNVLYRKKAILDAGGFNKNLITCEDEELDFRIKKKGYKILFDPFIAVKHYRRATYKKIFFQAFFYAYGRAQAIKLHFGMARWFHFVPTVLVLSLVLALALFFIRFNYHFLSMIYIVFVFLCFLFVSLYLNFIKKNAAFYTYLLIILCWFIGWGGGFVKGLIGSR